MQRAGSKRPGPLHFVYFRDDLVEQLGPDRGRPGPRIGRLVNIIRHPAGDGN